MEKTSSRRTKPTADHAIALVKASVAAIPVFGGPIASLIGDYIPTATQRSQELAFDMLKQRLDEVADRVDVCAVNKDEFSELFKTCYRTVNSTHQRSKLKAVANLLANILLKDSDPEKFSYTGSSGGNAIDFSGLDASSKYTWKDTSGVNLQRKQMRHRPSERRSAQVGSPRLMRAFSPLLSATPNWTISHDVSIRFRSEQLELWAT